VDLPPGRRLACGRSRIRGERLVRGRSRVRRPFAALPRAVSCFLGDVSDNVMIHKTDKVFGKWVLTTEWRGVLLGGVFGPWDKTNQHTQTELPRRHTLTERLNLKAKDEIGDRHGYPAAGLGKPRTRPARATQPPARRTKRVNTRRPS
jgi:hypothetical protein